MSAEKKCIVSTIWVSGWTHLYMWSWFVDSRQIGPKNFIKRQTTNGNCDSVHHFGDLCVIEWAFECIGFEFSHWKMKWNAVTVCLWSSSSSSSWWLFAIRQLRHHNNRSVSHWNTSTCNAMRAERPIGTLFISNSIQFVACTARAKEWNIVRMKLYCCCCCCIGKYVIMTSTNYPIDSKHTHTHTFTIQWWKKKYKKITENENLRRSTAIFHFHCDTHSHTIRHATPRVSVS